MAGVCGSPISSADEAEPERTPAARPAATKSLKRRASLKVFTRTPQPAAHLLPRRLSGGDKKATPVVRAGVLTDSFMGAHVLRLLWL